MLQDMQNKIDELQKKLDFWRAAACIAVFTAILIAPAIKDIITEVIIK